MSTPQPTPPGASAEAMAAAREIVHQYDLQGRINPHAIIATIVDANFAPLLARVAELEKERDEAKQACNGFSATAELHKATLNIATNEINFLRRRESAADQAMRETLPDYDAANEPLANAIMRVNQQLAAAKGAVRALQEAQELISRAGGEMLALAMSGPKHPNFDGLCMGVFERAQNFKAAHKALSACAAIDAAQTAPTKRAE